MTIPQVPQFKECYLKIEFPTYDSLPQETKNVIYKMMKAGLHWYSNVQSDQVQSFQTDTGIIPEQSFSLYFDDEEEHNKIYYIDLYTYDPSTDDWYEHIEYTQQETIETKLYYTTEGSPIVELAPVRIKAFVDGVQTPIANNRTILSFAGFYDEHNNNYLSGGFNLAIKSTNRDVDIPEFPDLIDWKHFYEFTKNNHIVMFNWTGSDSQFVNETLEYIIRDSYQSIEAVYVAQYFDNGFNGLFARLDQFELSVDGLTDKNGDAINQPYYVIINPENLQIDGQPVQLVTGKLIIDTSEASSSSSPYTGFFHGAIDMCGFYQFNDTGYDDQDHQTIEHSFPEHQLHNFADFLNAFENLGWEYGIGFWNFGYWYKEYASIFDEIKVMIDDGTGEKPYNILCIKDTGMYNGYASESYFDPQDGIMHKLVNYDNHGYGNTSQTNITAWAIPVPILSDETM